MYVQTILRLKSLYYYRWLYCALSGNKARMTGPNGTIRSTLLYHLVFLCFFFLKDLSSTGCSLPVECDWLLVPTAGARALIRYQLADTAGD